MSFQGLLTTNPEHDLKALSATGRVALSGFAEAYAAMLLTSFRNHELLVAEFRARQVASAAGTQPAMDATEVSTYRAMLKALADTMKIQLAAVKIGSTLDYKHAGASTKLDA